MFSKYYFSLDNDAGGTPPPSSFTLSLANDAPNLTATFGGGTPPYHYSFSSSYSGTCNGMTITTPTGTTSSTTASTTYTAAMYGGTTYYFNVYAYDSGTQSATSNTITIHACLVPESLITLKNGEQKQLAKLKVGDKLYGENNQVESYETYHVGTIYDINSGLLKSSIGHIHLVNGGQQVQALDLKIGDKLKNINGEEIEILSIEKVQGQFEVINISTTNKTYYANGIATHNKLPC
ncbi:MAG: Hint domain-containing protein [Bacteroidota bacterium]|nr:Hint domain-containing protein [Bacteroidota bacterium]